MELKVWVDGIQRVVCGVSEQTTCQEVVIALAQAIGESFRAQMAQQVRLRFGLLLWPLSPKGGGWDRLLIPIALPQLLKPGGWRVGGI